MVCLGRRRKRILIVSTGYVIEEERGLAILMISKKCVICGREFNSHNGIEVCSDACRKERRHRDERNANIRRRQKISNTPIIYTCKICGNRFEGMRQKYCSDECRIIARKKQLAEYGRLYYSSVTKPHNELLKRKEFI